jgi:integrase
MGRSKASHTIAVIDGLYLKSVAGTKNLQAYCRLGNQTFRKSMKTDDVEAASELAREWLYGLKNDVAQGVTVKKISFTQLVASYLKTIPPSSKYNTHSQTLQRHFDPFFSSYNDVRRLSDADINAYLLYRRQKVKQEPSPQTLNRENTVLRQVLKYGERQGWIVKAPNVEHLSERLTKRRRRHFTIEEYKLLRKTALSRIRECKTDAQRKYTLVQRQLLYDVIMLMANSGLRVDELKSLTWRNVIWKTGDLQLEKAGKLKNSRKLVLRKAAVNALKRIAKRRKAYMVEQQAEPMLQASERVVALPTGVAVENFKKGFATLLEECGFVYSSADDRHSLTSLRHSYATFSLTRNWGKRPTISILAGQMGTSIKMIEQHYGHDSVVDYREELRGE